MSQKHAKNQRVLMTAGNKSYGKISLSRYANFKHVGND